MPLACLHFVHVTMWIWTLPLPQVQTTCSSFSSLPISLHSADPLASLHSVPQLGRALADLLFLLAVPLSVLSNATAGEGVSTSVRTGSPFPRSGLLSCSHHAGCPP